MQVMYVQVHVLQVHASNTKLLKHNIAMQCKYSDDSMHTTYVQTLGNDCLWQLNKPECIRE